MPLHPNLYARLLGEKIDQHKSKVWLINTGWTGGPFGVGNRMKLAYTRRMVSAALSGELDDVDTDQDPFFGLQVPTNVDGVPDEVLRPRSTWSDGQAYDDQAANLARMFKENFEQFAETASSEVREAGPN